jgi:hypothetical protein
LGKKIKLQTKIGIILHEANLKKVFHTKEEMEKRKSQITSKTTTRKMFSSNLAKSGVSFAAAQRNSISLRHATWQWQLQPINWGSKCKQFASRQ